MSDQQQLLRLIQDTAGGDRAAFKRLYELTSPKLFSFSQQLLNRADWAEDLLQETYIKVWHHASEYHAERGNVLTWMISILRYGAIDRIRAHKPAESLTEEIADTLEDKGAGPFNLASQSETAHALQGCLAGLTEIQQRCITLAFFEGLTHQELSRRLQHPLGTIKAWVRRGLISLRECLER